MDRREAIKRLEAFFRGPKVAPWFTSDELEAFRVLSTPETRAEGVAEQEMRKVLRGFRDAYKDGGEAKMYDAYIAANKVLTHTKDERVGGKHPEFVWFLRTQSGWPDMRTACIEPHNVPGEPELCYQIHSDLVTPKQDVEDGE